LEEKREYLHRDLTNLGRARKKSRRAGKASDRRVPENGKGKIGRKTTPLFLSRKTRAKTGGRPASIKRRNTSKAKKGRVVETTSGMLTTKKKKEVSAEVKDPPFVGGEGSGVEKISD